MSDLIYDGLRRTITLVDRHGNTVGTWPANNRVDSHATLRRVPDGTYPMLDRNLSHRHGGADRQGIPRDSVTGEYGAHGIVRLNDFPAEGRIHAGIGIHSGRLGMADRSAAHGTGPNHVTQGCIRTTDDAMRVITQTMRIDPLNTTTVRSNNGH
jgi:hypothetical protein